MKKAVADAEARLNALEREHHALEARLEELSRHAYLSPSEEKEVRELKKRKLMTKDQMLDLKATSQQQVRS